MQGQSAYMQGQQVLGETVFWMSMVGLYPFVGRHATRYSDFIPVPAVRVCNMLFVVAIYAGCRLFEFNGRVPRIGQLLQRWQGMGT